MKTTRKHIHSRLTFLLVGVTLLSMPFSQAIAADTKSKQERAAQNRLQQMQRKFEQDKAALEQENAALKEKIKGNEAKLAAARSANSQYSREAASTLQARAEDQAKIAEIKGKFEIAEQSLKQNEAQNKQLSSEKAQLSFALAEQKAEVQACMAKNTNVINLSKELMKKYEKAALSGVEPMTGLKGVEIENRFQDYHDQAENQIFRPRK